MKQELTRNTLYIIGNGFDLAHGLKTSYCDFLLWYLEKTFAKKIYLRDFNNELISIEGKEDGDCLEGCKNLSEFFKKIHQRSLRIGYNSTFIENIFKRASSLKWVDIESEYYSSLLEYYDGTKIHGTGTFLRDATELNKQLDVIKNELELYLIQLDKTVDTIDEIDDHFQTSNRSIFKSMVLNFNYTSTVERYMSNFGSNQVINIHGQLNNPNNPIIFGYGDERDDNYKDLERLNIDELLINFKSFGYLKTSNYKKFNDFINADRFDVKILGHSCGLSDRIVLSTIFEHVNCRKIEICYHEKSKTLDDHFEKTIQISRHFSAENKDNMRVKIVPRDKSKALSYCDTHLINSITVS